jgi:hypothetical protein
MLKLIFQPIRNFGNIIPWNQRFRALFAAVNEIIDRLNALEGIAPEAETVVEPEKTDSGESVSDQKPPVVTRKEILSNYAIELSDEQQADVDALTDEEWGRYIAVVIEDDAKAKEKASAEIDKPFDWKNSDDVDALKEFASKSGLDIPGTVKKLETIKDKIAAHLAAQIED